jgi:hypothetical protein
MPAMKAAETRAESSSGRTRPAASLAADDIRTGWHFSFFSLPNVPELLLAGRERPFWTWYARR